MNCRTTKLWLLQTETLKPTAWPQEVAEHVVACAHCAKVARKMRKLENKWRDEMPVAQETAGAKAEFLQMLRAAKAAPQAMPPIGPLSVVGPPSVPEIEVETLPADEPRPTPMSMPISTPVPTPKKKKKARRPPVWHPLRWSAVAAVMLLSVSVMVYLLIKPGETRAASTAVVDRLIDLNLQMTNADAKDRKRLFTEVEQNLLNELEKATLTDEEQEFANELLENCYYLAENDDPIEEANLITDLADKIKTREELATKKGNEQEKSKCSFQHKKVMQMGYVQIIDRIAQFKTPEGMQKPGYASFIKYDPQKQQLLQKMVEHHERERGREHPDLRKALEGMRKKGPGFGGPGFGGGGPGKGGPFGLPPFGGGRKK